jgi:hypothetical protein
LQRLRVLAFNDLTQGRDPLARLTAGPAGPDTAGRHQAGPQPGNQPRAGADTANGGDGPLPGDTRPSDAAPGDGGRASGHASTDAGDSGDGLLPGTEHGHHPGTGDDDRTGGHHNTGTGNSDSAEDGHSQSAEAGHGAGDSDGDDDASWDGCPDMPEWQHERRGTREDDDHDGAGPPAGPPAPFPALINLTIPAGTAYGWSTAPGEAGSWGLLDPGDTRRLLQAASLHPRTRWHVTLLAPDGTAAAHGCARGSHPWIPPPGGGTARAGPAALAEFVRGLNVTFTPVAKGSCDHADREDRYTPSRKLGSLVRARTARCAAPGCGAQAVFCDLDHTLAYPAGITCQCDLAPLCRHHHRCKQAEGWRLEQPEPGVLIWRIPAGRTYATTPTSYLV